MFDSAKHEIISSGTTYELVVKGVFGEDEDTYACRAVNSGGTKSSKADLKIKTPARLNVPPRYVLFCTKYSSVKNSQNLEK